jgi:hypothetical protein
VIAIVLIYGTKRFVRQAENSVALVAQL